MIFRRLHHLIFSQKDQGSALTSALMFAAAMGGTIYTIQHQNKNQRLAVDRFALKNVQSILERNIEEASRSPYAMFKSAQTNAELKACLAQDGDCTPPTTRVGFTLQNAAGDAVAGPPASPIEYDSHGHICTSGNCTPRFIASAEYLPACGAGKPSCLVAKTIEITYNLTRLDMDGKTGTYTRPKEIFVNKVASVGAFECPEGQIITGFENGEPSCDVLALANFTPVTVTSSTTTTPTTSVVTKATKIHTFKGPIPKCSNSTGEIPANRSARPVRSLPADRSSADWQSWHNDRWFAGSPTDLKGDRACRDVAYKHDLHCSTTYTSRLSSPTSFICGDFRDCTSTGKKVDCSFIEIDSSCNMKFVGCRGTSGCFAEGTLIRTADGSDQPIQDLNYGDLVYNPITKVYLPVLRIVEGLEQLPLLELEFVSGTTITVTEDHPFPTASGIVLAKDLRRYNRIITAEDSYEQIRNLKTIHGSKELVWNIELDSDPDDINHYVLANGIVSGDLYLQEKYAN